MERKLRDKIVELLTFSQYSHFIISIEASPHQKLRDMLRDQLVNIFCVLSIFLENLGIF